MSSLLQAAADVAAADHPYPLIRGGGLFLIGIGTGFLLGWIFPKRWIPLAVAGAVAGFVASGLSALLPSLGTPSVVQIAALAGAFVVEMGLIAFAAALAAGREFGEIGDDSMRDQRGPHRLGR